MSGILDAEDVPYTVSDSFREAENLALSNPFSGVLADIPTVIKARGEEKLIASSLQNVYPFLRAKVSGDLILPIIMPGGCEGEQSIARFFENAGRTFVPRRIRTYKRHKYHLPVLIRQEEVCDELQSFTMDVSWSGAFIVMNDPGAMNVGHAIIVQFPSLNIAIDASVIRIQAWGHSGVVPGIGLAWHLPIEPAAEKGLHAVLKMKKERDRDRLLA